MAELVTRNLLQFVNKQRTLTSAAKEKIFQRDNKTCQYCLLPADCIDHIIPYSYSPLNTPDNLVAACTTCNCIAGPKVFDDFTHKKIFILTRLCAICSRSKTKVWTIDEVEELEGRLRQYVEDNCVIVPHEKERQGTFRHLRKHKAHYQDRLAEELGIIDLP